MPCSTRASEAEGWRGTAAQTGTACCYTNRNDYSTATATESGGGGGSDLAEDGARVTDPGDGEVVLHDADGDRRRPRVEVHLCRKSLLLAVLLPHINSYLFVVFVRLFVCWSYRER